LEKVLSNGNGGVFFFLHSRHVEQVVVLKALRALSLRPPCVPFVSECMTVMSEEGNYYFKGDTGGEVCGLYLLTDPDRRVHLTLNYADIPCAQGGLISVSRAH
jgi:hypothetical protein